MNDTTTRSCPVCSGPIPPGSDRCPGCGKRVGGGETCPYCGNAAAAVPYFSRTGAGAVRMMLDGLGRSDGGAFLAAHRNELVCGVCGAHRRFAADAIEVVEADPRFAAVPPDQAFPRAAHLVAQATWRARLLKVFAGAAGIVSVACLALGILADLPPIRILAVLAFLGGALTTAVLLAAGRGMLAVRRRDAEALRLRAVADLARTHDGVLRLDDAAAALRLPPAQIESFLSALVLVDGSRVRLEVDDHGTLTYHFAEGAAARAKALPGPLDPPPT